MNPESPHFPKRSEDKWLFYGACCGVASPPKGLGKAQRETSVPKGGGVTSFNNYAG